MLYSKIIKFPFSAAPCFLGLRNFFSYRAKMRTQYWISAAALLKRAIFFQVPRAFLGAQSLQLRLREWNKRVSVRYFH